VQILLINQQVFKTLKRQGFILIFNFQVCFKPYNIITILFIIFQGYYIPNLKHKNSRTLYFKSNFYVLGESSSQKIQIPSKFLSQFNYLYFNVIQEIITYVNQPLLIQYIK
ncbi:hypothetical protein pb186bvf_016114, partial [Paramecium bursaria]